MKICKILNVFFQIFIEFIDSLSIRSDCNQVVRQVIFFVVYLIIQEKMMALSFPRIILRVDGPSKKIILVWDRLSQKYFGDGYLP